MDVAEAQVAVAVVDMLIVARMEAAVVAVMPPGIRSNLVLFLQLQLVLRRNLLNMMPILRL
jgi:hypothetical protein